MRCVPLSVAMASVVTASAAIVLAGCVSRAAPDKVAPPSPAKVESEPEPPPTAPVEEAVGLALRPVERPAVVPADFRFVAPRPAAPVPLEVASELVVTLGGRHADVLVALDGHAFRAPRGGRLTVGQLLLEDEEIAPGPHRLVALRDEGARRSVAVTWFWVHEGSVETSGVPDEPPPGGVVLVSPRGTYNGEQAADAVRVDAFALAPTALAASASGRTALAGSASAGSASEGEDVLVDVDAALQVRVAGPDGTVTRVTRGEPLAVLRLGSGDHEIEVTRAAPVDGGDRVGKGPWGVASRTITVNRELEPPEAP